MSEYTTFIFLGFVAIALALSRQMIGNGIYLMFTHWRETIFLFLCAGAGALFALRADTLGSDMQSLYAGIAEPSPIAVASTINDCKSFVAAKMDGKGYDSMKRGADPWQTCAQTFGRNYWKYDISVNGRNGGTALCDAYAHLPRDAQTSGTVKSWCDTVFSSDAKI
jgi:hypothetical protein